MAGEKGSYRSVYSAIWDDPEFQSFDPVTQAVFFCLRTSKDCNFPCIFPHYHSTLYERMPNANRRAIDTGIDTLSHRDWIRYERPILWIVKGLKNEPNYTPNNHKHVDGIANILKGLPKLKIVLDFAVYYSIPFTFDTPIDTGMDTGIDTPPIQGTGEGEGKGEGKGTGNILSGKPDDAPPYDEIISFLNERSGKSFRASGKTTREHIHARWKEGYRLLDFQVVITKKCAQWKGDPKMDAFIRPQTIFGTKFEAYLNEAEGLHGCGTQGEHGQHSSDGQGAQAGKYDGIGTVIETGD